MVDTHRTIEPGDEGTMRLWMIRTEAAWRHWQRRGVYRTDPAYLAPAWHDAYTWMASQLAARRGGRPAAGRLPVWAWYQRNRHPQRKPDLRETGYLPKHTRGVRLTIDVADDEVLLSDFTLWHYPLNYWYLAASAADHEAFHTELAHRGVDPYRTKPVPDPAIHARIVASWDRIFDLTWDDPYFTLPRDDKWIQAVVWEVRLAQVTAVTPFVAR